jgi:soluble epoxide hydrolase / lipid-phosphate phosphatase
MMAQLRLMSSSLDRSIKISCPVLFILATKDNVLTPAMAAGMESKIPKLTRREVLAGHWALWQATDQVNTHIKDWLDNIALGGKSLL